jgi:glycosyltransferase involved in cell wall biosynthesis
MKRFSVIIPVYNRPDEVDELLASFTRQSLSDFEIVIVEDGSSKRCDHLVERYAPHLNIAYYFKPNSGPGTSRNYGAERSHGDYLLFLDSDCTVPPGYLKEIETELSRKAVDAFGGPDRADDSFTPLQKAINYSMTSLLTTGGIRGRRTSIDRFFPRSFNMGIRREVFEALGGFSDLRFGEDIDLSYRIVEGGYTTALFPEAWVYHKRRTRLRQFFKQVFNSGIARVVLSRRHPGTLKLVHLLPTLFTLGCATMVILSLGCPWALLAPAGYALLIFCDSTIRTRSFGVGALSVAASFVQLIGYGSGFLSGWWKIHLLGKKKATAFDRNFYD